jgi:hypothetical protein
MEEFRILNQRGTRWRLPPRLGSALHSQSFLRRRPSVKQTARPQTPQKPTASPKADSQNSVVAEQAKEIADLRKKLDELKKDFEAVRDYGLGGDFGLYKRVSSLEHEAATFDPTSPGPYQRIDTEIGPLLVSLGKAEPYLDGYNVEIDVGNLSNATLVGFKISARWAKQYRQEDGNHFDWYSKQKKKELSLTGSLLSGKWNSVQLILPDTKPSDFGYLNISIETNTVSMGKSAVTQ